MNAGDTLRQGIELSATYETSKWNFYAGYAFQDATLDKCDDPSGECAFLEAGDRLPGIPRHRFKAGFDYWLTSKWKFGADLVAASNSPFAAKHMPSGPDGFCVSAQCSRVPIVPSALMEYRKIRSRCVSAR